MSNVLWTPDAVKSDILNTQRDLFVEPSPVPRNVWLRSSPVMKWAPPPPGPRGPLPVGPPEIDVVLGNPSVTSADATAPAPAIAAAAMRQYIRIGLSYAKNP